MKVRNRELLFHGYKVSVWDENVLDTDSGDGHATSCMYLVPLN